MVHSEVKGYIPGAEGKPSLNRAILVVCCRPEPRRSSHGQDEAQVTLRGGPNPLMLKN
jgi:hypothetical protein